MHNVIKYSVLFLLLIILGAKANSEIEHHASINMSLGNGEGQPSKHYWQQKLRYKIKAQLQPSKKYLKASAEVKYYNNSSDELPLLWFELPQQRFKVGSKSYKINEFTLAKEEPVQAGTSYLKVFNKSGTQLKVSWHDTFFSVELVSAVKPQSHTELKFEWDLTLINREHKMHPRSGYEIFENNKSILGGAQWFPRAVAYTAANKWSLNPFLGEAEFSLELADYQVEINLPSDYVVLATGELDNPTAVLSKEAYEKWHNIAQTPVVIYPSKDVSNITNKKWRFKAKNVRDFSFAAGNNLLWHTQQVNVLGEMIRLNVAFPDNGRWLWNNYAFSATYHSVNYLAELFTMVPFKTLSVINLSGISMEYPGIKFVGFRGPDHNINDKQASYSRTEKYDVIGGIIHEIAHSYFPMTVNIDERVEGFFDEGLTSYLSYLVEQAWNPNFQSFYGKPYRVHEATNKPEYSAPYKLADDLSNKLDSHYHVPAVAFNVLNQSLLDKGQFQQVLADFIHLWQGKRSYFKDFTNFVEAQSNKDLQWFWHYWFETNKHVDLAIEALELVPSKQNSDTNDVVENNNAINAATTQLKVIDPAKAKPLVDSFEGINPNKQDKYSYSSDDTELSSFYWEKCLLDQKSKHFAVKQDFQAGIRLQLNNLGGIPAPIVLKVFLDDGTSLIKTWPAELWLEQPSPITLAWDFAKDVQISCIVLDPNRMTGDIQRENNLYIVK